MDERTPYPAAGTKLPTGHGNLIKLRKSSGIYVDKTDMVLDLASNYSKVFLSRPRRFGKTLLASTFETLFRDGLRFFGGSRRLYKSDGRVAEEPFKIAGRWDEPAYPVVRLDFSFMKSNGELTGASIEEDFRDEVAAAFEEAGFQLDRSNPLPWTAQLKKWLVQKCPPASIVLLIDEYDAGLGSRLNDKAAFERALSVVSSFFTMVKAADKAWRFVFITGVARFGRASVFSSMNDLIDITFMPKFGTLLGYTEAEIRENFAPYLEKAAAIHDTDVESLLEGMRRHYDGFCFDCEASTHVYTPWSVLNFLASEQHDFPNYWADSSGNPSALMGCIKSGDTNLKALMSELSVPLARLKSIMAMEDCRQEQILNQSGYLTIVGVKGNRVALGAPNLEVAATLADLCLSKLLPENTESDNGLPDIYGVLQTGDPYAWRDALNAYLSFIPYLQYPIDTETDARGFALALALGRGIDCVAGRGDARGRSDLEVHMPNVHWVMEFKFVREGESNQDGAARKALEEAMSQVKLCRYGKHVGKLPLVRVALVFSKVSRQIVACGQVAD